MNELDNVQSSFAQKKQFVYSLKGTHHKEEKNE